MYMRRGGGVGEERRNKRGQEVDDDDDDDYLHGQAIANIDGHGAKEIAIF